LSITWCLLTWTSLPRFDRIVTPGDGLINFQGMQDATAEGIKSLEGFRIAWVEKISAGSSQHGFCFRRSFSLLFLAGSLGDGPIKCCGSLGRWSPVGLVTGVVPASAG